MHPREFELFQKAADLPTEERAGFLRRECGADDALRERLARLLAAHDDAEASDTCDPVERDTHQRRTGDLGALLGRDLGDFRITRFVAAGGMGAVFEAEQQQPRRRVALKVLHTDLLSQTTRQRFEFEIEVLGRLDHPNIARILGAGTTELAGQDHPWFAMEFIEGPELLDYATSLTLEQRLDLWIQLCQGIRHAHLRGVVHRDLKPDNILIDDTGNPRILDFGIASAADRARTPHVTRTGQVLGTLSHMSPEQLEGSLRASDPRTDVWALGVLGYELLCSRAPYVLSGRSFTRFLEDVRHRSPPRPSLLEPALNRDLDVVLMTAMAKEADRRYDTAAELLEDLRRVRHHEPILARPASATYTARKLLRRHRGLVALTALLITTLIAGLTITERERRHALAESHRAQLAERESARHALRAQQAMQRAREEATQAEIARETATKTSDFLNSILAGADPRSLLHANSLESALDQASVRVQDELGDHPAVARRVLSTIGAAYKNLALPDRALEHLDHARDLCLQLYGPASPQFYSVQCQRAGALVDQGKTDDAVELYRELAESTRFLGGSDRSVRAHVLNDLGVLQVKLGELDEAFQNISESEQLTRHLFGSEERTASYLINYALYYRQLGREGKVRECLREALRIREHLHGPGHPELATPHNNLGNSYQASHQLDKAEHHLRRALEIRRSTLPAGHPRLGYSIDNLGAVLRDREQYEEAESLLREGNELFAELGSAHELDLATNRLELAMLLNRTDQLDEALELLEQVEATRARSLGAEHALTIVARAEKGLSLRLAWDLEAAAETLGTAYEQLRRVWGTHHAWTYRYSHDLVDTYYLLERYDDALALAEELRSAPSEVQMWSRAAASARLALMASDSSDPAMMEEAIDRFAQALRRTPDRARRALRDVLSIAAETDVDPTELEDLLAGVDS